MFQDFLLRPLSQRIFLLASVVIPLIGLLAAYPAYEYVKALRSQYLLEQSIALAEEEGNEIRAFQKALSAHYLNSNDKAIELNLARRAAILNHNQALDWWKPFLDHPDRTREDLELYLELAVARGEFELMRSVYSQYKNELPDGLLKWKIQLNFLQEDKRYHQAFQLVSTLIDQGQDDWFLYKSLLQLSQLLLIPNSSTQAIQYLQNQALRNDEQGLKSIRLLLSTNSLDKKASLALGALLKQHPLKSKEDTLLAYSIELKYGANYADQNDEILSHFNLEAIYDMQILTTWLTNQNLHQENIHLISQDLAQKDRKLYWALLTSKIKVGRTQEAFQMTFQSIDNPLTTLENSLGRALALKQMGEIEQYRKELKEIVENIPLNQYAYIEQELIYAGEWELLIFLYDRLAKNSEFQMTGWFKLLFAYYKQADEDAIFSLLNEFTPDDFEADPTIQSIITYLNLLYQNNMGISRRALERLYRDFPGILSYRILLALAYKQSGSNDIAQQLLNEIQSFPSFAENRHLLLALGITLEDSVKLKELKPQFVALKSEKLLERENRILQQILNTPSAQ